MKKAVLFLTFNRLDTTQKVFEQIKTAKPPRLYLASDGPRASKENEKEIVESVRKYLLDNINWDCEVKTLFRDENLGCGKAVSSAITWFFEQEEDGIILEDDCLPNKSFFTYCEDLLNYYKEDKRIWHISGDNFLSNYEPEASYYFINTMQCWGWASWADRWKNYEFDLKDYDKENLKNFSNDKHIQKYWSKILKRMKNHEIDTWDYQWLFAIVKHNGICINPSKNLISNIGMEGTHYSAVDENTSLNMPTYELNEIIHPKEVKFDDVAVDLIYRNVLNIKAPTFKDLFKYIKKYPFFIFRKGFWDNFFG